MTDIEKILEITRKVYEVNFDDTPRMIFLRPYPNLNNIDLDYYPTGWKRNEPNENYISKNFYYQVNRQGKTLDDAIEFLDQITKGEI